MPSSHEVLSGHERNRLDYFLQTVVRVTDTGASEVKVFTLTRRQDNDSQIETTDELTSKTDQIVELLQNVVHKATNFFREVQNLNGELTQNRF